MFQKKNQSQCLVNQGVEVPMQDETRKRQCQANVYRKADMNCQVNMQPMKSATKTNYKQSVPRPASQSECKKKDKVNFSQVKVSINDDMKCQSNMCSGKNCQGTKHVHM